MDTVRTATVTTTALLVDDDATSCLANRQRLEGDGYTVVTARDWTEGLGRARQSAPNRIFIHLGANGAGSLGFIEALRSDDACRHIPVVVLSGHSVVRSRPTKLRPVNRDLW